MGNMSKPMKPNPTFHSILNHLAEQAVLPDRVDLWPSIQVRLAASSNFSHARKPFMNINQFQDRRFRLVAITALIGLIVLGLLFATPQGQALAQNIMRYFTHSESDALPLQSWQLTPLPTPGTPTPDPASMLDARQSVAEVEGLASYKVFQPSWLPDALSIVGASYQPDHRIVRIFFRDQETNGLVLKQEPIQQAEDCTLCDKVGASASIEAVEINNTAGEYVEGVWKLTDNGPVWEPDPYLKTLRWQADQMAFELLYMGPPDSVSKADLIAIAQSIK
jgi:hypothetical protein